MDAHLPHIRYWFEKNSLYVKFGNMAPSLFNTTLLAFKQQFPQAKWRKDIGAWELPISTQALLNHFACKLLNENKQHIKHYTPKQLPLPLNWGRSNSRRCTRRSKNE